jgi:hypothetical protein
MDRGLFKALPMVQLHPLVPFQKIVEQGRGGYFVMN